MLKDAPRMKEDVVRGYSIFHELVPCTISQSYNDLQQHTCTCT